MGDDDSSSDSENEVSEVNRRESKHPIHSFFNYNKEKDQSVCKHCKEPIKKKKTTNLVSHLKKKNSVHFVKGKLIHHEEYLNLKATYDQLQIEANVATKRKKDQLATQKAKQPKIIDVSLLLVSLFFKIFIPQ